MKLTEKEMRYYVLFSHKGKSVAGTWVTATSEGDALLNAEFKLICMAPNVVYDAMDIIDQNMCMEEDTK